MDYADAICGVVDNGTIERWDDVSTFAIDNSHLAIFELHYGAIATKVGSPKEIICDDNIVVSILEAHAIS